MTNYEGQRVHAMEDISPDESEDDTVLADQPVLGVLTGQVPVSGPMGKGGGSFTDRLREQVRNNAEAAEATEDEPGSE